MASPVTRAASSLTRTLALVVGTALAVVLVLAGAPVGASAEPGSPPQVSSPGPARATTGQVVARIVFVKNVQHPFRSRVLWRAWREAAGGRQTVVDHGSWRAGSGFGGPHTTDECVRDRGWLPDGRYSFVQHDDYHGSLIRGRTFYLGNKRCRNGTERTDLFIHTETGAGNRPCADAAGDQLCRWEYPGINDYRSHGCVKMSPSDLLALTRHYHRWFRAEVRYPTSRVQVVVRHRAP